MRTPEAGVAGQSPEQRAPPASGQLLDQARADTGTVLQQLASQSSGLTAAVAESRLKQYGFNEIAREKNPSALIRLLSNVKNPLVILLTALGVLSFLTGDQRATVVIFVMVLLGVVLRFVQEMRADHAAEKLKAMVSNTATVVRDGQESELSLKILVPGDIVRLAAGDMVPSDVRVLSAKDLFVNQAALTGEALPVYMVTGARSSALRTRVQQEGPRRPGVSTARRSTGGNAAQRRRQHHIRSGRRHRRLDRSGNRPRHHPWRCPRRTDAQAADGLHLLCRAEGGRSGRRHRLPARGSAAAMKPS